MSDEMIVLYLESSGQILGALSNAAPPSKEPTVADVAGEAFVYRDSRDEPEVLIPAQELAVATVERDQGVLTDPHGYRYADGELVVLEGRVEALATGGGGVTVEVDTEPEMLADPPTEPPQVWVLARTGATGEPQISTATIALDKKGSTPIQPPLGGGSYDLVVLAVGYRPAVTTFP